MVTTFFSGVLIEEQRVFAYRLSRKRCTIENDFGILKARWHIFQKPVRRNLENTERYALDCLSLHNYLRLANNAMDCPDGFSDNYSLSGNRKDGEWRSEVNGVGDNSAITTQLRHVRRSGCKENAVALQNAFTSYFRDVPWQWDYVRRTPYQSVVD